MKKKMDGYLSPEKDLKGFKVFLTALNLFKNIGFDLKYEANDFYNFIIEFINSLSPSMVQKLSQRLSETQMMGGAIIEQGKGLAMFVADYIDHIKNAVLDDINLHFNLTFAKLGFKVLFSFPGLTQFLHEKFLSSE